MPACSVASVMSDSAIPWTVACQAPQSMRLSSQEYWSGLPFPSPGELPDPGIEPKSPAGPVLQADYFLLSHEGSPSYSNYLRSIQVINICDLLTRYYLECSTIDSYRENSNFSSKSIKYIYIIYRYIKYKCINKYIYICTHAWYTCMHM